MKSILKNITVAVKGACMGAADVIPGVSGGTIAFISGIYEELIESIRQVDLTALRLLCRGRFRELWQHINGAFSAARAARYRHCDLFAGPTDDMAARQPPHRNMVVLLRTDYRFGTIGGSSNRALDDSDRRIDAGRNRCRMVDYRSFTGPNARDVVVHLTGRSDCHLRP